MSTSSIVRLKCHCGAMHGEVDLRGSQAGICYCDDCRAFMRAIEQEALLDEAGGSHIVQVRPAHTRLLGGQEHLSCLRLSDTGMYRFYAGCCRMPLGNVMSKPVLPFIGLARAALLANGNDDAFPEPMRIQGRFATSTPPAGTASTVRPGDLVATMGFLARNIFAGAGKPHPYLDAQNTPLCSPRILSAAEREALRARDAA